MDGEINITVTVLANTQAVIRLPEKEEEVVVGSGTYHYVYATDTNLKKDRFTMDTTLGQLIQEPLAVQMFEQAVPGMLEGPMIKFAYGMTLSELLIQAPKAKELYESVLSALNQQ